MAKSDGHGYYLCNPIAIGSVIRVPKYFKPDTTETSRLPEKFLPLKKYLIMSKDEIKQEINKVLDKFPDNALQDLLSFLKGLETKPISLLTGNNFKKILSEDKGLLEKLAK